MSRARPFALALALAAASLAVTLAGCISIFPKQVPAQLYRFDAAPAGAPDAPAAGDERRVDVVAPPVVVERAAATDRILAMTGPEAAFIAGARWVSPAAVLWDEAVRRAFATRSLRVRLLDRTELAGGRAFLRISVPVFEVRYAAPDAAPTVAVTLRALYAHRSGAFSAERTFTATAPAAENRVGAIVPAFDTAVEHVTTELLSWADAHADEAAVEVPAPGQAVLAAPAPVVAAPGRPTSTTTRSSTVRTAPRP